MTESCRDWEALIAARASGEDLPGSAGLDAHLGSCPACREALASWRAMASLMAAHPVPADPARRARVGRQPRRVLPLAAAATLLLGLGLWRFAVTPRMPSPAGLPTRQGSPDPGTPAEDWRMAWLEPPDRAIVEAPGIPEPGDGFGGMDGGPGGPPRRGGAGGGAPRPWTGALAVVQGQVPFTLWVPDLPEGLSLSEARVVRPGPGRIAVLLRFRDGERELVLMEEPGTSVPPPLPGREGWRSTARLKDGLAVTLAAKGLDQTAWEALE